MTTTASMDLSDVATLEELYTELGNMEMTPDGLTGTSRS